MLHKSVGFGWNRFTMKEGVIIVAYVVPSHSIPTINRSNPVMNSNALQVQAVVEQVNRYYILDIICIFLCQRDQASFDSFRRDYELGVRAQSERYTAAKRARAAASATRWVVLHDDESCAILQDRLSARNDT